MLSPEGPAGMMSTRLARLAFDLLALIYPQHNGWQWCRIPDLESTFYQSPSESGRREYTQHRTAPPVVQDGTGRAETNEKVSGVANGSRIEALSASDETPRHPIDRVGD